jgi:4'-phosphopantetheinyl transferase EntD
MSIASIEVAELEEVFVLITPRGAAVAACRTHPSLVPELDASERRLVEHARPNRSAEFAAGRRCAHRALACIGADVPTIGRGARREPVWPDGVTGSISHAAGLAVAAAMRRTPLVDGLGIDVELVDAVHDDLWADVLHPAEIAACERSIDPRAAAAAMFCSKEAAFKALFPRSGCEIPFLGAVVDRDTETVAVADLGVALRVRTRRLGGLVGASATLAATP